MTQDLIGFLRNFRGRTLLAVFPHADDASFVAGGLFQLLQRLEIKTTVISLAEVGNHEHFVRSNKILGVDNYESFGFEIGSLNNNKVKWITKLKEELSKIKPAIVLTFDPKGITGNAEHTITSMEVLDLLTSLNDNKPELLWRISDKEEISYFQRNQKHVNIKPTFKYNLRVSESISKLKAIFSFKDKLKSFLFKLRIVEWYLLDHKELYYRVDLQKKYRFVLS